MSFENEMTPLSKRAMDTGEPAQHGDIITRSQRALPIEKTSQDRQIPSEVDWRRRGTALFSGRIGLAGTLLANRSQNGAVCTNGVALLDCTSNSMPLVVASSIALPDCVACLPACLLASLHFMGRQRVPLARSFAAQ